MPDIENSEGMAASIIDWIMRRRVKNKAAKAAAENQLADGLNIQRNVKDAKQVSIGVLA